MTNQAWLCLQVRNYCNPPPLTPLHTYTYFTQSHRTSHNHCPASAKVLKHLKLTHPFGKLASFVATDTYAGTHITYGNSLKNFDKRLNMVFLFQNTQICLRGNAKWQTQLIQDLCLCPKEVPRVVILRLVLLKPRSLSTPNLTCWGTSCCLGSS